MEKPPTNPIKYMNEFRYRHNMSSLLSERYRIPYKENSRAIDDKFRIIYFYQSHDGCEIMRNPSEAYEVFEITEKNKEFMLFYAKSKIRGETTIILLQSTDAPANRDRYSFISNIARKHISLENSINRRFT
jgi:hypothetical protein